MCSNEQVRKKKIDIIQSVIRLRWDQAGRATGQVHGFNDQELCDDDFLSWQPKELEDAQELLDRMNEQSEHSEEVLSRSVESPSPPSPSVSSSVPETLFDDTTRLNEDTAGNNALLDSGEVAENAGSR